MTPLSSASPGVYQCSRLDADGDDATRLKRLGICEGRRIQLLQTGDPMIVLVVGARVGVSRQLAGFILVEEPDECIERRGHEATTDGG